MGGTTKKQDSDMDAWVFWGLLSKHSIAHMRRTELHSEDKDMLIFLSRRAGFLCRFHSVFFLSQI